MSRTLLGALIAVILLPLAPASVAAGASMSAPSLSASQSPGARSSSAAGSIEDYAAYQPATRCSPQARPGTKTLAHWLVRRFGGGLGPISRSCGGIVSEHTEGRAFDWTLDATTRAGRRTAQDFLDRALATDAAGNTDALARRMGIMYVIWDDQMYPAWNGFDPEPYLSSSCHSRTRCSTTLRHRDHLRVSLTRRAARGQTSWYLARSGA